MRCQPIYKPHIFMRVRGGDSQVIVRITLTFGKKDQKWFEHGVGPCYNCGALEKMLNQLKLTPDG